MKKSESNERSGIKIFAIWVISFIILILFVVFYLLAQGGMKSIAHVDGYPDLSSIKAAEQDTN